VALLTFFSSVAFCEATYILDGLRHESDADRGTLHRYRRVHQSHFSALCHLLGFGWQEALCAGKEREHPRAFMLLELSFDKAKAVVDFLLIW
jgi:hypothetical protein